MDAPTRIKNLTGSEHCRYCCESPGLAVVAFVHVSPAVEHTGQPTTCPGCQEQTGPCPMCERGLRLEFPGEGKRGPWGNAGFWRGVSPLPSSIVISCRCDETPVPTQEGKRRVDEMLGRLQAALEEKKPKDEQIDPEKELAAARRRREEAERTLAEHLAARPSSTLLDDEDEIEFPAAEPTTLL